MKIVLQGVKETADIVDRIVDTVDIRDDSWFVKIDHCEISELN